MYQPTHPHCPRTAARVPGPRSLPNHSFGVCYRAAKVPAANRECRAGSCQTQRIQATTRAHAQRAPTRWELVGRGFLSSISLKFGRIRGEACRGLGCENVVDHVHGSVVCRQQAASKADEGGEGRMPLALESGGAGRGSDSKGRGSGSTDSTSASLQNLPSCALSVSAAGALACATSSLTPDGPK